MRIKKVLFVRVGEAKVIPWGYGLAYWDFCRDEGIFYPIPFNLIARLFVSLYWRIVHGWFPSKYERMIINAKHTGYQEGYAAANKWIDYRISDLEKELERIKRVK